MDQTAHPVPALHPPLPVAEVAALAARYRRANSGVMAMLNRIGTRAEAQMAALPAELHGRVLATTESALSAAYGLAGLGAALPPMGQRGAMALAVGTGAVGGFGGMATAVAELPVTVTLILRAIREVAAEHGFDPEEPAMRRETPRVLGARSPMAADDGVNSAFIGARRTLTGPALQRMIAMVAPRLAATLGQKLAAQAVPVLGAVAGAGLNAAYMRYFREMAAVRFGLLRLAQRHDPVEVLAVFRAEAARDVTRGRGPGA
ncbi:MAG: EcsC family protein [Gemmobacter sp.]